jgi:hypothetical protein
VRASNTDDGIRVVASLFLHPRDDGDRDAYPLFSNLIIISNDPVFALSMHNFSISSYGIRQALIVLLDNVPARITRRDRTCPRSRIEMRDYRPRIAELTA